jgi:hypothetical protein
MSCLAVFTCRVPLNILEETRALGVPSTDPDTRIRRAQTQRTNQAANALARNAARATQSGTGDARHPTQTHPEAVND